MVKKICHHFVIIWTGLLKILRPRTATGGYFRFVSNFTLDLKPCLGHCCFLINNDGFLDNFCSDYKEPEPSRRQDFSPDAFIRSGSIYLTKTHQIINQKLIRGSHVRPIEVSEFYSINIDEEIDFYMAEALINSNKYKKELDVFTKLKFKYEV